MEANINIFLQSMQNPIFTSIAQFFAIIGDNGLIFILIGLVLLFIKKYRKKAIFLLTNLASCAVVGMVLKKIIGRERPCFVYPNQITCFNDENQFTSMPSGHMIMAASFCFVMMKYYPKYNWLWITIMVVMAITRMYLGAHFISDIIVAVILAFVIFLILNIIWKKMKQK